MIMCQRANVHLVHSEQDASFNVTVKSLSTATLSLVIVHLDVQAHGPGVIVNRVNTIH